MSRFILGHRSKVLQSSEEVLCEPLEQAGFNLVDLEFHPSGPQGPVLRLFVDRPGGVDISGCTQASRLASSLLDVEDTIRGSYSLEVSSPGLERRLATAAEIDDHLGQSVVLRLVKGQDRRQMSGILKQRYDDALEILESDEVVRVPLEHIQRMNLIYDFGG